jgi:DNA-binding NarL/FixJ family response regulator
MISVVSTDGRFASVAANARQGHVDCVVIPLNGFMPEDVGPLKALKSSTGVRLVGIAPGKTIPSIWAQILDRIASRSSGADGLRKALNATQFDKDQAPAPSVVREPAAAVVYGVNPHLTRRELQVAQLVSQGMSNRRIAETLGIREQSVKNLVSMLMRKLRCENRVQVALHLTGQGAFTGKA